MKKSALYLFSMMVLLVFLIACVNDELGPQGGKVMAIHYVAEKKSASDTTAIIWYLAISTDASEYQTLPGVSTVRPRVTRIYLPDPTFDDMTCGEVAFLSATKTDLFHSSQSIYKVDYDSSWHGVLKKFKKKK